MVRRCDFWLHQSTEPSRLTRILWKYAIIILFFRGIVRRYRNQKITIDNDWFIYWKIVTRSWEACVCVCGRQEELRERNATARAHMFVLVSTYVINARNILLFGKFGEIEDEFRNKQTHNAQSDNAWTSSSSSHPIAYSYNAIIMIRRKVMSIGLGPSIFSSSKARHDVQLKYQSHETCDCIVHIDASCVRCTYPQRHHVR